MLVIPWEGPFRGASAAVATLSLVPILVSGWIGSSARTRRASAACAMVAAGFIVGTVVAAVIAGFAVRSVASDAVGDARRGLTAAETGDLVDAAAAFDAAASGFADVAASLDAWWMLPTRAVPVLAQNLYAVESIADDGRRLAEAGAAAAREADLESLRLAGGQLSPTRIAAMEPALVEVSEALDGTLAAVDDLESAWLLPPLRDRLEELRTDAVEAAPAAELAVDAVRVAPALLGGDGTRRYFVAVVTPAESRGLGGFMGNWVELEATDGHLEIAAEGRTEDLGMALQANGGSPLLRNAEDWDARYARFDPAWFWHNVTLPPDLPTVAELTAQVYPQSGGQAIDGVITIDPSGLAALLRLTGPVEVDGLPDPLTAQNAEKLLLRDQYALFEGRRDARADVLATATRSVFDRLLEMDLPGPRAFGDALGGAVREGRIQVYPFDPTEQALFERWGATGAMPAVGGDFLQVVTQNAGNNKIDAHLTRRVDYQVRVDPEAGYVRSTVAIELVNDATPELPREVVANNVGADATNVTWLNVYSPLPLLSATIDGRPARFRTELELHRQVHWAHVDVPPGGTARVHVELGGDVALENGRYVLTVGRQPVATPDELTISVTPDPGTIVAASGGLEIDDDGTDASLSTVLTEPVTVTASIGQPR